ncbi:MAG TPA: DUF1697 domain-containing protein [Actinomycetota bacterium]|nr:DUF1697 domain-containing protein [Actinomycetota bacterium]
MLYLALLRGINVGGKNMIKMADLKACFEAGGFADVSTYIASGNVLFRAPRSASGPLARRIERMLTKTFGYQATLVLRSHPQMRAVVEGAPAGFGSSPSKYLSDVFFLKEPLTATSVVKALPTRPGVDELHAGKGVVYSSRLASRATQSRINKVASLPIYRSMTIRSWSTTTKLFQLMDEL